MKNSIQLLVSCLLLFSLNLFAQNKEDSTLFEEIEVCLNDSNLSFDFVDDNGNVEVDASLKCNKPTKIILEKFKHSTRKCNVSISTDNGLLKVSNIIKTKKKNLTNYDRAKKHFISISKKLSSSPKSTGLDKKMFDY